MRITVTSTVARSELAPKKPYDAELAKLAGPYEEVAQWKGIDDLRHVLMDLAGGPALFIGTGGTLAVAQLAAALHEQVGGQPARALTPLELATLPPMTRSGAVLFSSGLKHPDALGALDRLANSRFRPAAVVTLRDYESVAEIIPADVQAAVLPPLTFREGFLATTSVLVMATALVRAYGGEKALPAALPRPVVDLPTAAEQLLVLTTPALAPVATDIETRCHELGLVSVQVTDYRNFAHGRHVGLLRRAKTTRVLGLVDQPLERLARATLDALPPQIDVTMWRAAQTGPAAVIELLVASMDLTASMAAAQGVNPSRPGAAPFGRRLYHLRLGRLLPPMADGPVERKLRALVTSLDAETTRQRYDAAFDDWRQLFVAQVFGALVLDYDGTVCATESRFDLPGRDVRIALIRLLDHGIELGFASGRGPSLHRDLRRWVPRHLWPQVITGLYNGGACFSLDDDLPDLAIPRPEMWAAVRRLEQLPVIDALVVEPRASQVTLSVRAGAYAQSGRLAELVLDAMSQPPELPIKVVRSGHSIDIVPRTSSKRRVIDRIIDGTAAGSALAIGDQGDVGGNDFELLASSPWTLTVDHCSADPSRCWYLDTRGRAGPELLVAYLEAMQPANGGFAMRWTVR